MRRVMLAAVLALGVASPLAAWPDTAAYGGWQCTAYKDSLDVYYWLKNPKLETDIAVTDKNASTDRLTDTVFTYGASAANQYFAFSVTLSHDYKITRKGSPVDKNWLLVDILDESGAKIVSKPTDGTRGVVFFNEEAMPLIAAVNKAGATRLDVRLRSSGGETLATYGVPIAGFREAMGAGVTLMQGAAPRDFGVDCT